MYQANLQRLKRCMRQAQAGAELTIGFIGGSITQGSLAAMEENTYARRVYRWWEEAFPQARFHYVNGGIGGTDSHFGAARAVSDLLMYQPDLVVVDFCVNDKADAFFQETFEGLARRILTWPSEPAVVILCNVEYDTGKNAQEYHDPVAEWYGLPCVSMKDTLYQRIREGRYSRSSLTSDGLHPNDLGHGLVAEELTDLLEKVKECMWEEEPPLTIPEPMTENAYERAKRLTIRECCPKLHGFRADAEEKKGHLDWQKNGWIGRCQGDRIVFSVEGSCIALQYRKTINKPAACARAILDGNREKAVFLDGNFHESWGDCLYLETVLHHGTQGIHRVEIEIVTDQREIISPFYLLSLIVA